MKNYNASKGHCNFRQRIGITNCILWSYLSANFIVGQFDFESGTVVVG